MIAAAGDEHSELRLRMTSSLRGLGERLSVDEELQHKVDDWVMRSVGYVIDHYRNEVSDMIASTVERWDADTTSRKMELQVGRDLQFIRINGTIVGGLAGVVIHAVGNMLGCRRVSGRLGSVSARRRRGAARTPRPSSAPRAPWSPRSGRRRHAVRGGP